MPLALSFRRGVPIMACRAAFIAGLNLIRTRVYIALQSSKKFETPRPQEAQNPEALKTLRSLTSLKP